MSRSNNIKYLYNSGTPKKEILKKLYIGLDPRLKKLAMQNIESHLTKLEKEKHLIK